MDIKQKLSRPMYFVFAIAFFISAVVTCGILMTLILIFVWPFSPRIYRRICYYFGYTMFAQSVFVLRWWATTDLKLYIEKETYDKYLGKEHSLVILNHAGELDWIIVSALLDKLHTLGNVKAYTKDTVKYIPFVGWGFWCCEFLYLSRSYEKDKKNLEKYAKSMPDYEEPITILLFPEGTRLSPNKHAEGIKFCQERGLREMKHHLVPRTKGFTTSVPVMRDKIPAIYDVEIVFEGVKPTIINMLQAKHFIVHMYLKRIPMEELPKTEKDLDMYLRNLFYKKDDMMESFLKTKDFFELSGVERLQPITINRHVNSLYNTIMWFVISVTAIIYFIAKLIISGRYILCTIFILFIAYSFKTLGKVVSAMEVRDSKQQGKVTLDKITDNMEVKDVQKKES